MSRTSHCLKSKNVNVWVFIHLSNNIERPIHPFHSQSWGRRNLSETMSCNLLFQKTVLPKVILSIDATGSVDCVCDINTVSPV